MLVCRTAEELLTAWFEPAPRKKEHFILATAILEELSQHVKASDMPSLKQLTMTLRQCRYPYGAANGLRGWYAHDRILRPPDSLVIFIPSHHQQ